MRKSDVLIVKYQANSYFLKHIKANNKYQLYKIDKYKKICRYIDKYGFDKVPFSKWVKQIKNAKVIVFFDTFLCDRAINIVKEINADAKVYIYFWNKINDNNKLWLENEVVDDIYTFDQEDSNIFNIKYNTQFYSKNIKIKSKKCKYDVCFLGREKGRKKEIGKIKKIFDDLNLKTDIRIIEKESDFISYDKYLKMIENSKCILDMVANNQKGASLRVMESIFLKKKLITNNKNVANYDFYNKNNIFIIGIDNFDNFFDFLNSEYVDIDSKIIDYYDYENWVERFK